MYKQDEIIKHIKKLNIKPDDTVIVHASLKSVGELYSKDVTSAEVMINALMECLYDGLLLIPAHTWRDIRKNGDIFDVKNSVPCVGAIPCEAVKMANKSYENKRSDIIRSLHPTHSVVAIGKKAAEYVKDDLFATTPAPFKGSYGKLYGCGGKILLIGVGQTSNTYIHAVDEWLDLPKRLSDKFIDIKVRDYNKTQTNRKIRGHINGTHEFSPYYEPYFDRNGGITYGYIGDAFSRLCDARICADTVRDTLKNELKVKSEEFFSDY